MTRRRAAVLAVAIAAAALAPVAIAAPQITTLKLVEVTTLQKLVDSPPAQRSKSQPLSPGDIVVVRANLLSAGEVVGTADFFGVVTAFPRIAFYGTFSLPGGKISIVDVGSLTAASQTFAVVGGTGRYAGVRGIDRERRIGEGRNAVELELTT